MFIDLIETIDNSLQLADLIRTTDSTEPSDSNSYSALRARLEFALKKEKDIIQALWNFLQGFTVGNYIEGSSGAEIDSAGNAEVESIVVRSWMKVYELIYNRLNALEGNTSFSDVGTIESITVVEESQYFATMRKRWDGDFTAFQPGDVVYGYINNLESSASGDYRKAWAWVRSVDLTTNTLELAMYPDSETPAGVNNYFTEGMVITRWGNNIEANADTYSNPDYTAVISKSGDSYVNTRQSTFYISCEDGNLVELMGVNKPILEQGNYGTILGKIPSGLLDSSTEELINSDQPYLFARGIIVQDLIRIGYTGVTIRTENYRGTWSSVTAASETEYYRTTSSIYDTVTWGGSLWQCLVSKSTDEPSDTSAAWLRMTADTSDSEVKMWSIVPSANVISVRTGSVVPSTVTCTVTMNSSNNSVQTFDSNYALLEEGVALFYSTDGLNFSEFVIGSAEPIDLEDETGVIELEDSTDNSSILTIGGDDIDATTIGDRIIFELRDATTSNVLCRTHVPVVKDGVDANFTSYAFIRSNTEPSTPEGGTYDNPVPTTEGWSDGIPEGEAILWCSTRVFSVSTETVWETPRQMTDTATYDVEFSDIDESPGNPTDNPDNWFDPEEDKENKDFTAMLWRAERQKKNGEWSDWTIVRIKGEKGDKGVGIVSANIYFATSSSDTVAPTEFDANTYDAILEKEKYLWQATKMTYTEGDPEFTAVVCLGSCDDFASVTEQYSIGTVDSAESEWSETYEPVKGKWLWARTELVYVKGADTTTNKYIPEEGGRRVAYFSTDGITVVSSVTSYSSSESGADIPSEWQSDIPEVAQGHYLWTRLVTTYSDTTISTSYSVSRMGTDGVTISSISVTYALSSSGVQPDETEFKYTSVPELSLGAYLWTRTVVVYSDDNISDSYSVSRIGTDGTDGTPGGSSYLHIAYASSADGSEGFSTTYFDGAEYIGIYSDSNVADSENYADYTWSKLKGDDGVVYEIIPKVSAISASADGTITTGNIGVSAFKTVGTARTSILLPSTSISEETIEHIIQYSVDGGKFENCEIVSETVDETIYNYYAVPATAVQSVKSSLELQLTSFDGATVYKDGVFLNIVKDGADGADGADGIVYDIVTSTSVIVANADGDVSTGNILVTAYKTVGSNGRTELSLGVENVVTGEGYIAQYSIDSGEFKNCAFLTGTGTDTPYGVSSTEVKNVKSTLEIRLTNVDASVIYKSGHILQLVNNGKDGLLAYPAGVFDEDTTYKADSETTPVVLYNENYYRLNRGCEYTGNSAEYGNPALDVANNGGNWTLFDKFNSVFAEIVMAAFAKLASAVFYGDWMLSQQGTLTLKTEWQYLQVEETTIPSSSSIDKTERNPTGWSTTFPTAASGYTIYGIMALIHADDTLAQEWSDPVAVTSAQDTSDVVTEDSTEYQYFKTGSFVPNYSVNFKTGEIYANNARISGDITGRSGTFSGTLNGASGTFSGTLAGVTGTFKTLEALDSEGNVTMTISFNGTDQQLLFQGADIGHQGTKDGRSLRFLAANMWVRKSFGAAMLNTLVVNGTIGTYYTNGLEDTTNVVSVSLGSSMSPLLTIPLYGTTDDASGFPVDLVIFTGTTSYNYVLSASAGKYVKVFNANGDLPQYIYCNGNKVTVNGGVMTGFLYVGLNILSPTVSSTVNGAGWVQDGSTDNDWS